MNRTAILNKQCRFIYTVCTGSERHLSVEVFRNVYICRVNNSTPSLECFLRLIPDSFFWRTTGNREVDFASINVCEIGRFFTFLSVKNIHGETIGNYKHREGPPSGRRPCRIRFVVNRTIFGKSSASFTTSIYRGDYRFPPGHRYASVINFPGGKTKK